MKNCTTTAVILGNKNFSENDKIIFLYSEQLGKIKVVAKGARKITSKFTGHLETLNFIEAGLYFGPKNIILREVVTTKNFKYLRENFEKLTVALKIAELTNKITYENQNIEKLTDLIKETLQHLKFSQKENIINHGYILKFFNKLGLIPDFKSSRISIETKYKKYFEFIKVQPFAKIEQINLSKKEHQKVDVLLHNLITDNCF